MAQMTNSIATLKGWFDQASASLTNSGIAVIAAQARAEAAERELEELKVAEGETQKALEEARRQTILDQEKAQEIEKLLHEAEEKTAEAARVLSEEAERFKEEIAQSKEALAEAEVKMSQVEAEAEAKTIEAEKKVAEAEAKAIEAEKQVAEAIHTFRQSPAFDKEITRSTAWAYNLGFRDCRSKIKQIYNLEGIEEVEPDVSESAPSSPEDTVSP